jgi:endogenous inhibitor of DNA gyrase (YacG/DUF329 family)
VPACPICKKPVPPRAENRSAPFCSERCKLLDLGKWLGEEYRVAGARAGDGAERPADPDDAEADA